MSWRLASCDWLESAAVSELSVAPRVFVCVHWCTRGCVHVRTCVCVCVSYGDIRCLFSEERMKKHTKKPDRKGTVQRKWGRGREWKKGFGGVAGLPPSNAASRQPGGNSIKDKSRILYFVSLMWGQSKRRTHLFEFPWPLYHKRPSFAWICGQKISLSSRHLGNKGGNRCLEVFPPFPQSLHRLTLTWQNPAAALCNGLPVYCCETSLCY